MLSATEGGERSPEFESVEVRGPNRIITVRSVLPGECVIEEEELLREAAALGGNMVLPPGADLRLDAAGNMSLTMRERTREQLQATQHCSMDFEVRKPGDASESDHVLDFIGSTSARDSYGDRIAVKGWDLTRFKKNPVFMPVHRYGEIPLGRALKVRKNVADDKLEFRIKFATDLPGAPGERALDWYNAYKSGYVKGSSVGFMPIEWKQPQSAEEREKLGLGRFGVFFTKQELLELSAAPIPSNPEAMVQLALRNHSLRDLVHHEVIRVLEEQRTADLDPDPPEEDHDDPAPEAESPDPGLEQLASTFRETAAMFDPPPASDANNS